MTKSKSQVLKEKFREKFFPINIKTGRFWYVDEDSGGAEVMFENMWNFIESSLTQQKSEMIKEIKGMKRPGTYNWSEENAINKALDEVIEQLKK
jgi:hypothetical protein